MAHIKENLAAGTISLANWTPESPLDDPFFYGESEYSISEISIELRMQKTIIQPHTNSQHT